MKIKNTHYLILCYIVTLRHIALHYVSRIRHIVIKDNIKLKYVSMEWPPIAYFSQKCSWNIGTHTNKGNRIKHKVLAVCCTPSVLLFKCYAFYSQLLVSGASFLLAAGAGMPIGYSAVLLPQLQVDNSTLPTDDEIGSWIGKYIYHLALQPGAYLIIEVPQQTTSAPGGSPNKQYFLMPRTVCWLRCTRQWAVLLPYVGLA